MPRLAASLAVLLFIGLAPEVHGQRAACQDGRVTPAGSSLSYACSNVDFLGHLSLNEMGGGGNVEGNDIWGWTDPDTGKEYALVGLENGTSFVDVSDPTSPVYLGRLPTRTFNITWRDIKVYEDHAFIVSEAEGHGMQVFDLTQLRGVTAPVTFSAAAIYDGFGSSHNVAINEASGFAYAVGSAGGTQTGCSTGLHMVNIQTPTAPTFAGCFDGDGYTHDVQCVTYDGPDTDYTGREICFASNGGFGDDFDRYAVVDVTDKSNPTLITQMLYPTAGYAHQGWLTEDSRYFIANDELDETAFGDRTRTLVFDVSDLDDAEFLDAYDHGTRASDHNMYIRERFVYASNYTSGLRILDTQEIESGSDDVLSTVAFFDTFPFSEEAGFQGTWSNYPFFESGIVIVNDISGGLFILDPQLDDIPPVSTEEETVAAASRLQAAFPNPTSGRTTLTLTLDQAQEVSVVVYDALGRRVATLFEGALGAEAARSLVFDGSGRPAGLYVVRAVGETFSETQRIV
ncbi:MAG: choice-of-anchor B family protein, partial [Bacteroidota bacterium]